SLVSTSRRTPRCSRILPNLSQRLTHRSTGASISAGRREHRDTANGGKIMRVMASAGHFRGSAIAGTRAVMIALDCKEAGRKGLLGFAFRRSKGNGKPEFLRSLKVF